MTDLTSRRWIMAKGWMFLAIAGMTAYLLFASVPTLRTAALIAVFAWASCRFYYFLFYVLEKYVDPRMRYSGLWHLTAQLRATRKLRGQRPPADMED